MQDPGSVVLEDQDRSAARCRYDPSGYDRLLGREERLTKRGRLRCLEELRTVRVRPCPPEDLVGDLTERMTPERQARRALFGEDLLEDRPVPCERRGVRPEPVGNGELGDRSEFRPVVRLEHGGEDRR